MALVTFGHAGLSLWVFLGKASLTCWKEYIHYLVLIDAKSSCRRKTTENFWMHHVPHLCSLCGVSRMQVLGQRHYWLPGDIKGNKSPFQQETGKLFDGFFCYRGSMEVLSLWSDEAYLYMQLDLCPSLTAAKLSFYAWSLMRFFADIEGCGKNSASDFLQCCLARR